MTQPRSLRVAVVADTHAPRFWKGCPPGLAGHLDGVDLILHAGDACTAGVLHELETYAPVRAVLGNNDGPDVADWGAPVVAEFELAGVVVAMIHDGGPAKGRFARLRVAFPSADLVVFGHSHIPAIEEHDGFRIFNPGSPTDKRRQPHKTMGMLEIGRSMILSAEIIVL